MDKLWEKRRRPTPLNWENMPEAGNHTIKVSTQCQREFHVPNWTISECHGQSLILRAKS